MKTIEVKRKKYEECGEYEYNSLADTLCIEVNGKFTFYKEVKKELTLKRKINDILFDLDNGVKCIGQASNSLEELINYPNGREKGL